MEKKLDSRCEKTHLILDANNLLFRARHACANRRYDNVIVHTFFRSLKPIVEKFDPDFVYFVLDGKPVKRLEIQPDYKGTREYHDKDGFREQRKTSISMVKNSVPFTVLRHPFMEADDVIAHMVLDSLPSGDLKVIVSSDTDFIQLCQDSENTKLYNPIKKNFREVPEYPYAEWKALRGDGSDNIAGIRGIGNKRAANLLMEKNALANFFENRSADIRGTYEKNLSLIKLTKMSTEERLQIEVTFGGQSLETLRDSFTDMKLKSMITDKAWKNYSGPFRRLQDGRHYITE